MKLYVMIVICLQNQGRNYVAKTKKCFYDGLKNLQIMNYTGIISSRIFSIN